MRKLLFSAAILAGMSIAAGAAAFEGNIDYEIHKTNAKVIPLHYEVKPPHLRVTMQNEGKSAIMIFDTDQKVMYILSPERKMAMKHTVTKPAASNKSAASGKKATYTNTGKTETIAGHTCTVYAFEDDKSVGDVCNAEGLGTFYLASSDFRSESDESNVWAKEAREKQLFPLRATSKDKKTGDTMTIIATHIESKSIPSSEFEVPSDYKVMDTSAMMGGGAPGAGSNPTGAPPAFNQSDFMKKMMTATPEERQKMADEMRQQYGNGSSQQK